MKTTSRNKNIFSSLWKIVLVTVTLINAYGIDVTNGENKNVFSQYPYFDLFTNDRQYFSDVLATSDLMCDDQLHSGR